MGVKLMAPKQIPRRTFIFLLLALPMASVGCQTSRSQMPAETLLGGGSVVQVQAKLGPARLVSDTASFLENGHDANATKLSELWRLAEANNPTLREATADVDIARGQQRQAGRYPNPRFVFSNDLIGSRA